MERGDPIPRWITAYWADGTPYVQAKIGEADTGDDLVSAHRDPPGDATRGEEPEATA